VSHVNVVSKWLSGDGCSSIRTGKRGVAINVDAVVVFKTVRDSLWQVRINAGAAAAFNTVRGASSTA